MATGQLNGVVRHLRRMAREPDVGRMTDGQLLESFIAGRDETAFEGLVRRFGPMVLGVCQRVLRDRHDAEDAFQATFLVLLRKARSIARPELIGNWLYGTAFYTAQNARVSRARRRAAERQVPAMPAPSATEVEIGMDLGPVLDEELSRLPEKYRTPVVLCELQGKSRQEVARQLGCPEGTLSSRLARARQLLRQRLSQRGLALSAAALAGMLTPGTASASVPAALLGNTVKAASALAAGNAAASVVSAPVVALTEGVLKAMFVTKLKIVVAVTVVIGVLSGGAGFLACQALAEKPAVIKQKEPAPAAAAADKQEKKEKGPDVQGLLKSVDAGKNTIAIMVRVEGTKQTEDKTFDLSRQVKVILENNTGKKQPGEEGKLTDLLDGTYVHLSLSADKKAVETISARGPGLHGPVKSVDAARNTITVATKDGKGSAEKTVELAKEARILLNDGMKKGDPDKEGKLSDLTEGALVSIQLHTDQKTALSVRVQGESLFGNVKSVDGGNNTITISVKENGQLVDKTFTVAPDARIEGKLTDLAAETPVSLQFSVFDKKKIVGIRAAVKNKNE